MKIAVIQRFLPGSSRGGAGHFTHGLSNALQKKGHEVTVFSQDPAPEQSLYRVRQVPKKGRQACDVLAFPFQIAKQDFSSFDLIHAQGDDHLISRKGKPLIRTFHGSAWREALHNGLERRSLKHFLMHFFFYLCELISCLRADGLAVDSRDTGRDYPRRAVFIPNGVDLDFFAPRGKKSSAPSIFFVGEIHTRKRGALLIKKFQEEIRPRVPGAELWLVCPEKIEGDGIRWFGQVSAAKLAELYQSAWVFCLPSAYEGFGRPYIEAMAAGTPVVASPNPGAKEILEEGKYGFIVRDEDLGKTLRSLLTDSGLREKYTRLAVERAGVYSWEKIAGAYEALYETARR